MKRTQFLRNNTMVALAVGGIAVAGGMLSTAGPAAAAGHQTLSTAWGGTVENWVRIHNVSFSKLRPALAHAAAAQAQAIQVINHSLSRHEGATSAKAASAFAPPVVRPTRVTSAQPGLQRSWEGINAFTETSVSGFTFTPPDQGLCTGNGFVFEIINNAVRVFRANGRPASPTVSSNSFFGLPPVQNPTTKRWGVEPTDPTCTYDPQLGRWFVDQVVIKLNPKTGANALTNWATLAVSTSSSPLGSYHVYQLNLTDTHAGGMHVNCPCIGDFPKIQVDGHALFLSTNQYPWSGKGFYGNGFNGAQLYAASKRKLAAGASTVPAVRFSNTSLTYQGRTVPGFTLWPAAVPNGRYATGHGGTEYFVSSAAAQEANPKDFTGFSNLVGVYQITNTASLDSRRPRLTLTGRLIPGEIYGEAPLAGQKPGPVPLRDCLAVMCAKGVGPSTGEQEGSLDPSDTRPLTVWYAGGRLTMALDTVMQIRGNLQAGPAWYVINPSTAPASARILDQGYIGLAGNNVIYPTLATNPAGNGVMAFALAGRSFYPTQGYLDWSPSGPASALSVTVPGAAPLDDFCQYNFFNCAETTTPLARPRYGDYSWATFMNGSVYIATEDVSSRCTFAQFAKDPTCGGTRAPLSNWSTRISAIRP